MGPRGNVVTWIMGDVGLEHPPLTPPKTAIAAEGGAKSGARDAANPLRDSDLALLVERWSALPKHVRAAIRTLVQAHAGSVQGEHQT